MNIIYVPARSSSKRLLNKNFKPFHQQISITEIALRDARLINYADLTVLDTDSDEFLLYAKKQNLADYYIKRPEYLASDQVTTATSLSYCISEIETTFQAKVSTITLLQPTSPVRSLNTIHQIYNYFISNCLPLVASATYLPTPLTDFYLHNEDNSMENIKFATLNRPVYFLNGGIFLLTRSHLFTNLNPFIPQAFDQIYLAPIIEFIDIDTKDHFELAKILYNSSKSP